MIPEKDKRYLIKYKFGQDHYTDIGTYTGKTYSDRGYTEYVIEVDDGTILATYEEIIECVNNPHDGSTLDNFLLEERLKAWEKCADDLVDYAHEFVAHLSAWGKGYDRYDKDIKKAEDAIEQYYKLKNEKT